LVALRKARICGICQGSPTPRAPRSVATPTRSGTSNLDAIINEGTLTTGWVGPARLGILIAAFGWAGRVFEWLGTLATWLFSGEWRNGDSGAPCFDMRLIQVYTIYVRAFLGSAHGDDRGDKGG